MRASTSRTTGRAYLLRQIKERSGEAVYKTCSEGVAKWG